MSDPHLIRKDSAQYVVSENPDVCLTPMGSSQVPVPYISTAFYSEAVRTANSVRVNGKPSYTVHSRIPRSIGTGAGTGKGVTSAGHLGPVRTPNGSKSINIESKEAVRVNDTSELNMSSMK